MAEKDAASRLRKAVKKNNLFLVKRLVQRTNIRNTDSSLKRFTSLAWAAVLGNEETFEFLLSAGHDDTELSRDSECNTILMLLADLKPIVASPYASSPSNADFMAAALRMARLYHDRYSEIINWTNSLGKTALHLAALRGNEELVRMLCDLGADFDMPDNKGDTPLHCASAWGHITIVQLLIERGCQFAARNNLGFTASDYAYSTKDTLQDSARMQFENNKKTRRQVFAQAAAKGHEWGSELSPLPPPIPPKNRDISFSSNRMRSGSGTSRTTATSDSGEHETNGRSHSQHSLSSSPPQMSLSANSGSFFHASQVGQSVNAPSTSSVGTFSSGSVLGFLNGSGASHSPIVSRMRERDADAIEKYLKRSRSGSSGQVPDERLFSNSLYSSAGPSPNGDDVSSLKLLPISGSVAPRRILRPSMSAAQLRTTRDEFTPSLNNLAEVRNRSGTSPGMRPIIDPALVVDRSPPTTPSLATSPRSANSTNSDRSNYTGPPSQYAQFPEPPSSVGETITPTQVPRRLAFHLLSKAHPTLEAVGAGHRRGSSAAQVRGG